MKAILRSINNFSCKLKQSNNLKYNISPKIRSNKFKSISGNDNVTIEDALNKDLKDYKVYGNTYQNSTTGKNLLNVPSTYTVERTNIDFSLQPGTYIVSCESPENYRRLLFFRWQENTNNGNYVYIEANTTSTEFTITKEVSKLNFYSRDGSSASTGNTSTYKNLMIRKSDITDSSYEPYTGGQPSPNPDYPQEIVSCGDRTKNLLNIKNIVKGRIDNGIINYEDGTTDLILNKDSFTFTTNANWRGVATDYIEVEPLTIYMLSYNSNSLTRFLDCYDENKNWIGRKFPTNTSNNWYKYETLENTKYIRISWQLNPSGTITISYPQIEKGSIVTSYEPYGYKIPVNVRSENLLKLPDMPSQVYRAIYTKINDNSFKIEPDGTAGVTGYVRLDLTNLVKPNTTYTFSRIISKTGYNFINEGSARVDINGTLGRIINTDSFNIAVPSTVTRVWLYLYIAIDDNNLASQTGSVTFNNVMLEEGSTAPSKYIPYYNQTTNIYLDEPLRKIDEYSDYIDFINGKVVRNIKEMDMSIITGWRKNNTTPPGYYRISAANEYNLKINKLISNIFKYDSVAWNKNNEIGITNLGNLWITPGDNSLVNPSDVPTWLQNKNAYMLGILETPTEESITLPNIKLIEGKNIITIGTEVQGVFEAEYYSKEIIDISNYKYNLRKVED